jgi:DNA-binding NarL/FixJ family response regulator/tetratricopeptide (TPR) repeat protein
MRFSSRPPGNSAEPTILLVGADRSFHTAIASALAQHGVYVETSPANGVVDTVVATAPDLVVLVGDAASGGGSDVLASLNASPHSSVVPVALLADDSALGERLRAFRHGAAAVIPRSASVDAIADQIARLAREIPERDREGLGNVGEATLQELVEALSKELRTGILSVRSGQGKEDEAIRVVLGGGRPLAQTIDEFVSRLRRHVVHAEPLMYEFDERAGGTVQMFGGEDDDAGSFGDVTDLRILLADPQSARADAVAQALRKHGADVVVTDFEPSDQRFNRLRQLDPTILLIDEVALRGEGYRLVRRLRRDTRLRWASLLVLDWNDVWSTEEESPTVERMLGTLATLAEPERGLRERVDRMASFDTRLEVTGPARMLRAFAAHPRALRVYIYNPRVNVRVDFSESLVSGARAQVAEGATLDGTMALAALMMLSAGRVHVERIDEPELVNVMATVDVALNQAEQEAPPLSPSLPAPDAEAFSMPPPPESRGVPKWVWIPLGVLGAGAVAAGVVYVAAPTPSDIDISGMVPSAARTGGLASSAPSPSAALSAESAVAPSAAPSAAERAPDAGEAEKPVEAEKPPAPKLLAGGKVEGADMTPDEMAVKLESSQPAASCEKVVGSSWKLLTGDQPGRAHQEIAAGRRALIVGKMDAAQVAFCRAAVLDTANPDSFTALIRVLLYLRDPKQAREWAERAIKHHPNDTALRGLFGDALARAGESERAVGIWLDMAEVSPNDAAQANRVAATYVIAAERALSGADYAQADRLFRRGALIDSSNARAAGGLAKALLLQNEIRAAAPWAVRAVSLDPRDPDIRLTLGDVYEKLGDIKLAYGQWSAAVELDPSNSRAHARLRRVPPEAR